jgi:hypothetical protein
MAQPPAQLRVLAQRGSRRSLLWVVLAPVVCVCAGCGPPSDRLEITGNVTLDGAPLDGGSIRFTSSGDEPVAAGAMIENGAYKIPQEKGLPPGTYYVDISAPDTSAPPVMARATPGGRGIPVARDRIPPEYNINSKQTVEVSSDSDNHFTFAIVSRRTN